MWHKLREFMERWEKPGRQAAEEAVDDLFQAAIEYNRAIALHLPDDEARKALRAAEAIEEALAARRQARLLESS